MTFIVKSLSIISLLLAAGQANAAGSYSFGLGLGTLYSGVGANVSMLSDVDMKYLSVGCLGYSTYAGYTCGAGLGWIKTDLFGADSNNHGLGVYLGAVGSERTDYNQSEIVNGVGIGYYYFFNGISAGGTNLGIAAVTGNGKYDSGSGLIFQLGYQF
ncbi:hypothetical protein [Flavobacterium sp. W21_SRS_FM6]|uniref:hypothetical protein n=1 Tax=Flavobacterium sp. W21_SRS_FM6 TaxID=3240268 RepID=UPI003F8F30CE